jgi:hypothetical protein
MSTTAIIVLVVVIVAVLVLAAIVAMTMRQRARSRRLRQRYGDEYDLMVGRAGNRRRAESELQRREQRRQEMDIRPLEPGARAAFAEDWRRTQEEFVDRPVEAVKRADLLVVQVMKARGYPAGDFEQQARDVSVDHASVIKEYRAAHKISARSDDHRATTEELRQAMKHYRALFSELLEESGSPR